MATYDTSEFRTGLKVFLEGDPCEIIESEFVKPGKGQAFTRIKLKNLISGRVLARTYKSGESIEAADVVEVGMQYLYKDADSWYFMKNDGSYEQLAVSDAVVGDQDVWLKEQDVCEVTIWDNNPIAVTPPKFVELEVKETDPGLKGDTAQGGSKPATMTTGAVVKVPLFINIGETLRIDTRTGEYKGRAGGN